jgi:ATP-dependent Clp protease, protease subunit
LTEQLLSAKKIVEPNIFIMEVIMLKSNNPKIIIERTNFFSGEVNFESIQALQQNILSYLQGKESLERITLIINSTGGTVVDGFAFYDFIKFFKIKLITIGLGCIQSMGLILFLCGQYRIIGKHAEINLHPIILPKVDGGNINQTKKIIESSQLSQDDYINAILEHSNKKLSKNKLNDLINKEARVSVEDAIRFGWAHEIIE